MTDSHDVWTERVLGYEDLDGRDRALADEHLATCERCRMLRGTLTEREYAAFAIAELPAAGAATGDDEQAERASREALRDRLGAGGPKRLPATLALRPRRFPWVRVLVPVAAAAAVLLAVFQPWRRTIDTLPLLGGAQVLHGDALRGAGDASFHTGDAFTLRVHLARPGVPVVLLLDAAGEVDLLYPEGQAAAAPAGDVELPPPGVGIRWRLSGPAGLETLLIAASGSPIDPARERADARAAAAAVPADRRADALAAHLTRRFGHVERRAIRHLP